MYWACTKVRNCVGINCTWKYLVVLIASTRFLSVRKLIALKMFIKKGFASCIRAGFESTIRVCVKFGGNTRLKAPSDWPTLAEYCIVKPRPATESWVHLRQARPK